METDYDESPDGSGGAEIMTCTGKKLTEFKPKNERKQRSKLNIRDHLNAYNLYSASGHQNSSNQMDFNSTVSSTNTLNNSSFNQTINDQANFVSIGNLFVRFISFLTRASF